MYGALPFVYGTVVTSIIALIFAVPLSLGAALLVNEYLPAAVAAPVAYAIELLAAVPSVVYGFWGVIVVVPALRPVQEAIAGSPLGAIPVFAGPVAGPSYFVAGMVLAIMILPILTSVARDSIRATPRLQREGAMALGATHWETIRHVVLPFARGGIFAGIILGLSRAIGETIAVLFVIGNQPQINASIFSPGYTLPSVIASEFAEANQPFHPEALIGLGVVLFVMSFVGQPCRAGRRRTLRATSGRRRCSLSGHCVPRAAAPEHGSRDLRALHRCGRYRASALGPRVGLPT